MRLLINASNLHVGGGVQVATSFIYELSLMQVLPHSLEVWASSEVDKNLHGLMCNLASFSNYELIDSYGFRSMWAPKFRRMKNFDIVFTVFGPLFLWINLKISVMGFAQPWIIYPDNEIYQELGMLHKLLTRLKYCIHTIFFKRADKLIVELEHVKQSLIRHGIGQAVSIQVVHNCLSSLYSMPALWQSVDVPKCKADFKLGFVGRNYTHKNTKIFPVIRKLLLSDYNLDVRFFVTFTDEEWQACTSDFREASINVGPLSVAQCPAFYQAVDGIVFPSLLECFSSAPLEAMAMRKPLFLSDRPFNRDVVNRYGHYFDPMNPAGAATAIACYIRNTQFPDSTLQVASDYAFSFSSARERAKQYLRCLLEVSETINLDKSHVKKKFKIF